ncbi:MAG: AI-2E family transporter [Clostridia bacterium]|nr:AI-2E family transporter [Clostridia bacterium]
MNSGERNRSRKLFIRGIVIYSLLVIGILLIINLDAVNSWLAGVLRLLRPILIGLAVAYLCNPMVRFYERRLLLNLRPQGVRRTVSLILTYLTLLLIIALVLLLIVPQLIESIVDFAKEYDRHVSSAIAQYNKLVESINGFIGSFTDRPHFFAYLNEQTMRQTVSDWFGTDIPQLLGSLSKFNVKPITVVLGNAFSLLADTLFGFFISLYLLSTKEKRYAQVMKLRRALFGNAVNQKITDFCRVADRSFGGFIEGKLLDSLIIGVLTYVIISIFQIPYALLIAAFVGVTNIVPIIGPILGAIPTSFILLLTDPAKVIPVLIIIVVIQQLDGNVIGPKILGNNTGVSSLCVVIAIATMGSLWGLVGMILGVPLFATVLELVDELAVEKLQKKGMPSGLENYYAGDTVVDPEKNVYSTTDKIVQRLERHALRIEKKLNRGEALTRKERYLMWCYRMAHKYHIVNELSDEGQARFAAEDAAHDAETAATLLVQEHRNASGAVTDGQ